MGAFILRIILLSTLFSVYAVSNLVDYACLHQSSWLLNENDHYNNKFNALTDVISASLNDYQYAVTSNGIPNYDRVFTQRDIDELNSRPNAAYEFVDGKTKAVAGHRYAFGDNIGFKTYASGSAIASSIAILPEPTIQPVERTLVPTSVISDASLMLPQTLRTENFDYPSSTPTRQPSSQPSSQPSGKPTRQPTASPTGRPTTQPTDNKPNGPPTLVFYSCEGYWPPHDQPSCPSILTRDTTDHFNLFPAKEIGRPKDIGALPLDHRVGRAVNGIEFHSWNSTYQILKGTDWKALSPEVDYNVDMCRGHASSNQIYHHKTFSSCLAERLRDYGQGHSPIYGFANDGFPIYGPYHDKDQLATSCWHKRDYRSELTGCHDGDRSCKLVDEYDYTKGTMPTSSPGPSFDTPLKTVDGLSIEPRNGVFYEDYYFNASCASLGGPQLNQFNGHSHGEYGFHYHTTIDKSGSPTFPYVVGPRFYGCIVSRENSKCDVSQSVKPWNSRCLSDDTEIHLVTKDRNALKDTSVTSSSIMLGFILAAMLVLLGFSCGVNVKKMVQDKYVGLPSSRGEVIDEDRDDLPLNISAELIHVQMYSHASAQIITAPRPVQTDQGDQLDVSKPYMDFMAVGSLETAELLSEKQSTSEIGETPLVVAVEVGIEVAAAAHI